LEHRRNKARRLLESLNAWAEDIPLLAAQCNALYNTAMQARDEGHFEEAMMKLGLLRDELRAIDEDLKVGGIEEAPRLDGRRWR
jgi:GTP-dependent phosphoenolpyruvate carboxykinase